MPKYSNTISCISYCIFMIGGQDCYILHLQEFRRRYGVEKGLPPEHPRAGSTDDVEGIFAFLHGLLGPIFYEKAFHDVFPKVISEYTKKCDPDLPFYYYTGSNDCFNDGSLASFNVLSSTGEERLDRVRISRI